MQQTFGEKLDHTRKQHLRSWKIGFWVFLALAVAANIWIRPLEGEYGPDVYPGFWAAFGLLVTVAMVFVMKKIIQPLLVRPEEKVDVE